jgi:hypothetical protein
VSQPNFLLNPNTKHFDLSEALREILRKSTIDWRFKHIKRHTTTRPFTRHADLNDEMDKECKAFLDNQEPLSHEVAEINGERASIWLGPRKVVSNVHAELSEYFQDARAQYYWEKKRKVEPGRIDWEVYRKARSMIPRQRQVWLMKQSSSFCACGKMMQLMGKWESDQCPRCELSEDAEHIWVCGAAAADAVWSEAMERLSTVAAKFKTPEVIATAMAEGIRWWRLGEPETASSENQSIQMIVLKQHDLGWRSFCEGHWDPGWQQAYKEMGGPKDGKRWAAALIQVLWETGWKLWEQRNEEVHKKDDKAKWRQVDAEIKELKEENLSGLSALETNLYRVPLETILQWDPGKRQAWLSRIQAAKKEKERRRQANPMEGMRRVMANFLRR